MEQSFAHMPIERRAVARLVLRDAREVCNDNICPIASQLEHCVAESVDALASVPITTHLHLFAIRRVRECIRSGSCEVLMF